MVLINHIKPTLQQKHALVTLQRRGERLTNTHQLYFSIVANDLINTDLTPMRSGNTLQFFDRHNRLVAEIRK